MAISFEERRKFVRFKKIIPVRFHDNDNNCEGCAETHNVSAKGLCFGSSCVLTPNAYVDIWLYLPGHTDPLFTQGRVVWTQQAGPNWYNVGVDLSKVDFIEIQRILLDNFQHGMLE